MKKLVALIIIASLSVTAKAQLSFMDMINHYFKANPFEQPFGSFLSSLLTDHHFIKDELNKRTDSNFFFLRGHYTDFSPVAFTLKKTEIRVAEVEFNHADSLHTLDTMIVYQLLCITDSTDKGKDQVKKEFIRFQRRFGNDFTSNEYKYTNGADGQPGMELYNYYFSIYSISPITVAWGKMIDGKDYVFTLTLRMKQVENQAALIQSPDGF
jgi:hypothetical protein